MIDDNKIQALQERLEDIEQAIDDLETEKDLIEEELDELEEERAKSHRVGHVCLGEMGRINYSPRTKLYIAIPSQGKGSTKFDCQTFEEAQYYINSCWAAELDFEGEG